MPSALRIYSLSASVLSYGVFCISPIVQPLADSKDIIFLNARDAGGWSFGPDSLTT
jgi:hypothetical protein